YPFYDAEPDVFAYNFAGYSGQFVLDHNKQVHHLTNKNGIINILLDYENRQFTAIDNKVLKYILESKEITKSTPTKKILSGKQFYGDRIGQTTEDITAWFLSKIIGQSDTVEFSYNQKDIFYNTRISGSLTATWNGPLINLNILGLTKKSLRLLPQVL
ncbi:MAG: hypothetical protein LBH34_04730, partial [Prevotellaceae bacterium]|nr:hypothetical protein [Prevotellaceae bacterium]